MKLYTAEELAKLLRLNVRTIYRLGTEGKIKRIKVGRAVRFVLPEVEGGNNEVQTDSIHQRLR